MTTTTTTMKKLTKKDNFNALLALSEVQANPTLVEFITHEISLLDKKNGSGKKPTKQQELNEGIKDAILSFMEVGQRYRVADINKGVPECADLSGQRVNALVRQLREDGKVIRTEEKRIAYFSLPSVDTEIENEEE